MWSIFSRDPASSFPYEIQGPVISELIENRTIWKLHKGRKKANGDEVSIFICDQTGGEHELAKVAVKRLKTLRHPCVLTFIDSVENEKLVYLVTEPVTPLLLWLVETDLTPAHRISTAGWGLLQVTKGLSFLNNDAKMSHFNICGSSIYVTRGGEWKIGGVEYISTDNLNFPIKILHSLNPYDPPEKNNHVKMKVTTKWSADMWGLGCLFWEVFNGLLDQSMSLQKTSKVPKSLLPTYCELVGADPAVRPNPQDILEKLTKKGQFFNNDLIQTLLFLEEIQIKDDTDKHRFLSDLTKRLDNIPDFVAKNKILPAVLRAHEFSNVGSVVLSPLFKIGKLLEEHEYQKFILPCVVKLFSSTDRVTRLKLLQQIEQLSEHMDNKTVNEQIYPQLATGFLDTNPTIREHTVKAIFFLSSKLNSNNLNVEVLKHFARIQAKDDQGGIRTNTTVCLGKIACHLNPTTRQKCLISAFTRAMRDPFPPQRMAGATGLAATQQYYAMSDVATKILPVLCPLTMDPEKTVRESVFRVLKGFLSKLEKVSEDPTLLEKMESEVMNTSGVSGQVSTWAGWAMGAVTSKFYKSDIKQKTPPLEGQKTPSVEDNKSVNSEHETIDTGSTKSSLYINTPSSTRSNKHVPTDDGSDYEDWDNNQWSNNTQKNSRTKSPTVTDLLSTLNTQEGGDEWGEDDEDWGSLEASVDDANKHVSESKDNFKSSSSFGWSSEPSPLDDIIVSNTKSKTIETKGWDEWEDDGIDFGNSSTQAKNSSAQEREKKKLQRQKEIEAKRNARAGPMKLGAKKIPL